MRKKQLIYSTGFTLFLAIMIFLGCAMNDFAFGAKPDRSAPTAPSNLKADVVTDNSVTLTWSASTDNVGVKSYNVYMNNAYLSYTSTTTYKVTGLNPSTSYTFYVKAKDSKKNISKSSNIISVTTASVTPPLNTSLTNKVVGYYAAWSNYLGYTPDKIDASKLTHINYAFANIGSDLKISLGYPDIDLNNFKLLNTLKQTNPNLKTLISIGGWTWSGKFSDVALTEQSRSIFADSCVDFIVQHGFDGVDIDWEYPVSGGLTTNVKRPEDKENFTLLLKTLREKLDARGVIDQKHYLLSIAGGASTGYASNTELSILHQYLDYATIMTYDLHGTWDSYTDFNAPLYNNSDVSPQYKGSVDSSINAWLNASFPKEKLVMGVPFYGYIYSSVKNTNNGLYQTFSGANSVSYDTIATNYLNAPGYTRYFHTQSMVPWLFNGSVFISYEDPQSIALKADYIQSKGLGGAMIWELSQDSNEVLLNALYEGLK
jgi:chitinase